MRLVGGFRNVQQMVWGVVTLVGVMPWVVKAQGLLPNCSPIPGTSRSCGVKDIFQVFVNLYNFALGLAALVAFLFIIIGGVRLIVAYYTGDGESNVSAGKDTLRNGIVGFVIVLAAYLIADTLLRFLGIDANTRQQYFDGSALGL